MPLLFLTKILFKKKQSQLSQNHLQLPDNPNMLDLVHFPGVVWQRRSSKCSISEQIKKYRLEKINKYTDSGKHCYYDLTLLSLKNQDANLRCVVADTRSETSLEQAIRQQKFEIELLQAILSSFGNYMSGDILGDSAKVRGASNLSEK